MKRCFSWLLYSVVILSVPVLAHLGSRAVTARSEGLPPERGNCMIIDAGHGGVDGGATSCSGILESSYNLDIALKLNDLFRFLGYETKMIRTTDVSVYTIGDTIAQKKISDLKQRVRIVNETDNALLISIHQNTFPDGRSSGAQVFYAATEGSQDLARKIQTAFLESINPGSHRQCKKGEGIYLLEHISAPGVLVECGFLSNLQEEAKLADSGYQQKICCVIASAVDGFLSNA